MINTINILIKFLQKEIKKMVNKIQYLWMNGKKLPVKNNFFKGTLLYIQLLFIIGLDLC